MGRLTRFLSAPALIACSALLSTMPALSYAQDQNLGETLATKGNGKGVLACATCHGPKGEGNAAAGFPRLAGLGAGYMQEQLDHFASGKRKNAIMMPIVKQMSDVERKAVSMYFSNLSKPKGVFIEQKTPITTKDTGAWLATRGQWENDIPACVQCHGPGGTGVGNAFPPLAGQSSAYIAAQLHAFKSGERPGGPLELMAVIANKMSDSDIKAVSDHFGAVPAASKQIESAKEDK